MLALVLAGLGLAAFAASQARARANADPEALPGADAATRAATRTEPAWRRGREASRSTSAREPAPLPGSEAAQSAATRTEPAWRRGRARPASTPDASDSAEATRTAAPADERRPVTEPAWRRGRGSSSASSSGTCGPGLAKWRGQRRDGSTVITPCASSMDQASASAADGDPFVSLERLGGGQDTHPTSGRPWCELSPAQLSTDDLRDRAGLLVWIRCEGRTRADLDVVVARLDRAFTDATTDYDAIMFSNTRDQLARAFQG